MRMCGPLFIIDQALEEEEEEVMNSSMFMFSSHNWIF